MTTLLISPLQNGDIVVLFIVGFLFLAVPVALIQYWRKLLQDQLRRSYFDKIHDSMRFVMQVAQSRISQLGITSDNLQLIVMTKGKHYWKARYWSPNVRYGKHRVVFKRATAWMAYVDKKSPTTTLFNLNDQIRGQLQLDEDQSCFLDVNVGVVSPIFRRTTKAGQTVIGAFIIYSTETTADSISFSEKVVAEVIRDITDRISEILCYECLCV